jgi:hypothetical protein
MSFVFQDCPDCGERLAADAARCACGWTKAKRRKGQPEGREVDRQCSWSIADLRCRYPVGFFDAGATRGLCIFHRAASTGQAAIATARESQNATPEQFASRAKALIYGKGVSPEVLRLQKTIRMPKPGNLSDVLPAHMRPQREPGEEG